MSARTPQSFRLFALIISLNCVLAGRALGDGVIHYIIGTVKDSDGNPIAGINVTGDDYVGDDLPYIPSDSDGNYLVDAGTEGNYRITIACGQLSTLGFQCADPVAVSVSGEYTELDFVLRPALFQVTNVFQLPRGNAGVPYSAKLGAIGGQEPYTWQLAAGSTNLPPGLSLSSNGLISGIPLTNYVSSMKIQVTDANFVVTNKALSLTINPKPVLTAPVWITNRFSLRLTGATNQNYTLQRCINLNDNTWLSLFVTNSLRTNSFIVTDSKATNRTQFYRVMIGP
jgi:hypothetical protein